MTSRDMPTAATQSGKSPDVRQMATIGFVVYALLLSEASGAAPKFDRHLKLVFACRADNDLYQAVSADGEAYPRFDTPAQAIEEAPDSCGVLILADEYPDKTTVLDNALFEAATNKRLRLYRGIPIGPAEDGSRQPHGIAPWARRGSVRCFWGRISEARSHRDSRLSFRAGQGRCAADRHG